MNDRFLSLLGLARKAGKLSLGSDAAADSLKKGSAVRIFLTADLSPRTVGSVEAAAEEMGIEVEKTRYSMLEIGMAVGKKTGIVVVNDAGFAEKLSALHQQAH